MLFYSAVVYHQKRAQLCKAWTDEKFTDSNLLKRGEKKNRRGITIKGI